MTFAPADIYSSLIIHFCGQKFKLGISDPDVPDNMPAFRERVKMIARDPVASALFFHTVAEAVLKFLVGRHQHTVPEEERVGVLETVNSFFGMVECQGRGSEHLHMLIWLRYGCRPGELATRFKDQQFIQTLFAFVNDVICESSQAKHMLSSGSPSAQVG